MISSYHNKRFHALLSEILRSKKDVTIKDENFTAILKTEYASLEQLKMFLKMADQGYPRSQENKIKKTFSETKDRELVSFFGAPDSIKNISITTLLNHTGWIRAMSAYNKIILSDDEESILLKHVEGM